MYSINFIIENRLIINYPILITTVFKLYLINSTINSEIIEYSSSYN